MAKISQEALELQFQYSEHVIHVAEEVGPQGLRRMRDQFFCVSNIPGYAESGGLGIEHIQEAIAQLPIVEAILGFVNRYKS